MINSIIYGSRQIDFYLEFSERKSLGITVTPNLEVFVKAPLNTPIEKITEKLRKKAPWIIKQQNFFLTFYPKLTKRNYVSGETHLYMGRQYRLNVIMDESSAKKDKVKLKGQFIEVFTNNKSSVEKLVESWYLNKAEEKLHEIAKPLFEKFIVKYNLSLINHQISLKFMPTRWGSCTAKGKITLNPELIKSPKGCIEYVVIHELCHLVYHDHTQKFFDLQTKEMPDWEKWKLKLEKLLA